MASIIAWLLEGMKQSKKPFFKMLKAQNHEKNFLLKTVTCFLKSTFCECLIKKNSTSKKAIFINIIPLNTAIF